jgi:hypothetical protein
VTNGLAVRMAVLWLVCGPRETGSTAAPIGSHGGRLV